MFFRYIDVCGEQPKSRLINRFWAKLSVSAGRWPAVNTVVNGRDGRIWSQQRLYSRRFSPDKGISEPALSTRRIDTVVFGREVCSNEVVRHMNTTNVA